MNAVRLLTPGDIPALIRLKDAAGWNQTPDDWHNVMRLGPEGCFGIEADGTLVSSTTAVCYGRELTWIGMVLTLPEYRGRGFARRLMEHALDYLQRQGIAWIKLDATDMGRPLYQKLGFEDEAPIERWLRSPGPLSKTAEIPSRPVDLAFFQPLDREAFGVDRSELLRLLASNESAEIPNSAFAMGRPGSKAAYFGPCVSRSAVAARDLLCWFLSRHSQESVYWDILSENQEAVNLAREFGFAPLRRLIRMVRRGAPGAMPFRHRDQSVFAIAGFEYG